MAVSALRAAFDVLMADGEPRQKGECENHLQGWGFRNVLVKLEAAGKAEAGGGNYAPQGVCGG